ncbi:MAG: dprA [Herminiimonas sp.]|nr:dprA [Herminiimonas sp.]
MTVGEELAPWVRLQQAAGVGAVTARRLLDAFGLPVNIFTASYSSLREVVTAPVAEALTAAPSARVQQLIANTVAWADQPGNHVLTLADAEYPASLFEIHDPPVMLYIMGRLELLSRPGLAVVGSRNATAQGILNAGKFAEILSEAGLTIVSGMALGIDTAAHHGGLRAGPRHGAGSTIAVIGTGTDIVYPARNHALAHQIATDGCIVSEYALGTPVLAANFPRRNRIISGMAQGVLVVEAAARSGSLITARMALEQGREVFAIPGSIHSSLSKGCHQLIRQGAKLVDSAQDILDEFTHLSPRAGVAGIAQPPSTHAVDAVADQLLKTMGHDPVEAHSLAERAGLDTATINDRLLALELDGLIELLPGGRYQRLS